MGKAASAAINSELHVCSGKLVERCALGNVKSIAWNRNAASEEDVTEAVAERCAFT
jgi:hypothetical protein